MFSVGNQKEYLILNLIHYILLSYIEENILDIKWEQNLIKVLQLQNKTIIKKSRKCLHCLLLRCLINKSYKQCQFFFKCLKFLFGATNIVKNNNEEEYIVDTE